MKNILIVEDDSFKSEAIKNLFINNFIELKISLAEDVSTAVNHVNNKQFDLIIIDMALPSHPAIVGGGSPMSLLTGGLEILFELNTLNRDDPCIIVTQYPDIEISGDFVSIADAPEAIKKNFSCKVISCVHYNEGNVNWENDLLNAIRLI